ncbi:MAG: tRNA (N(6)-L-threonylcarbamoyladenosine(37)-C(2))-methylthiotransferase MtaB, partial [Duncaniella sp.]|nr:tRNA (N(6)-L-threonylcarbamoyladenosine(37)-C(2))-methylthiotransferase MtaB [Duncaniella sp.]
LDISRLHVFTYSERPGTRALEIEYTVSQEEKHRRTRIMLRVSEKKLRDFTERFVGKIRPILAEHPRNDGSMAGFTDNYLRVNISPDPTISNTIVPVRITAIEGEGEESTGEVISRN